MKTNLSTTARFQTGLIVAAACLGLLVFALVRSVHAAGPMMPSSNPAPAGQTPAPTMPAGGMMGDDMRKDMGAMMKNMSAMMDKMSTMMAAGQASAKADPMPMGDMARMGDMMKKMSDMMGMMGGASVKADTPSGKGGMCACCDMMMSKMDMAKEAPAKPTPPTGDAPPATDHSEHHPAS